MNKKGVCCVWRRRGKVGEGRRQYGEGRRR